MPKVSNKESVSFDELVPLLEDLLKDIDMFRNGEFVSKTRSEVALRDYRKRLSTLSKKITGAKKYSLEVEVKLVPKASVESLEAHVPDAEINPDTKVDVS